MLDASYAAAPPGTRPRGGRPLEMDYRHSEHVAAPAATCWELLTDPSRAHEWMTIVRSAEAEGEPGPGRVIHATGGLLGVRVRTQQTVHLWEPCRRYGWQGEDPFPLVVECTLEELAAGTELTVEAQAAPGRFFGVGRRVLRRTAHAQVAASARRFRELVEDAAQ